MKNIEIAAKHEDYIINMRRYFHENPELSDHEHNTVKTIAAELDSMGIDYVIVEKGGILATVKGATDNGKAVLLRADIDALPVQETPDNLKVGGRTCISKVDGVMHACGHDGHIAMLLGAAKILSEKKIELAGTVYLCFERGEEAVGNVGYIFAYIEKQGIKIDTVYGTHLLATAPSGYMVINDTNMMAGAMAFDITIDGRGGHGSRPDQAVNPIDAFWAIYGGMLSLRVQKIDPYKTLTYSVGKVNAGNAGNIIPQTANFSGSMRTFDQEGAGMTFYNELRNLIDRTCEAYGCRPIYNFYTKPGLPIVNDPELAQFARKVIGAEIGTDIVGEGEPWMASDSYSQYLKQWPGVYAFLGMENAEKGIGAAHHNQAFDVDESVLKLGSAAAATYAIEYLRTDGLMGGRRMGYREFLQKHGMSADYITRFFGE
ncbi:MAG: amidohydrolase [Oscillospiraceae bacterium]|nr:amidohydrolase [Oscillospiraceae bacterium]